MNRLVVMSGYHRSFSVFRKGSGPSSVCPSLLPATVDDLLETGHPCRGLRALVEQVLGVRLRQMCVDRGGIPYDPAALFGVWMYGLLQGEGTSRRLEEKCRYDVRYQHLCGGVCPDHTSLSRFREKLGSELDELMELASSEAIARGLFKGRCLAVDGTKVPARRSQWRRALAKASEADAVELKGPHGFLSGYNVQAAVDMEGPGWIAGVAPLAQANDSHALSEIFEAVEKQSGVDCEKAVADSGYDAPANLEAAQARGVQAVVNPKPSKSRFLTRDQKGELRCPAGYRPALSKTVKDGLPYDTWRISRCRNCPLKSSCGVRGHQKEVSVQQGQDPAGRAQVLAMAESEEGRRLLRLRGPTVERCFAQLKEHMKFRRFRLKNLSGARIEAKMTALAYNLRLLERAIDAIFEQKRGKTLSRLLHLKLTRVAIA